MQSCLVKPYFGEKEYFDVEKNYLFILSFFHQLKIVKILRQNFEEGRVPLLELVLDDFPVFQTAVFGRQNFGQFFDPFFDRFERLRCVDSNGQRSKKFDQFWVVRMVNHQPCDQLIDFVRTGFGDSRFEQFGQNFRDLSNGDIRRNHFEQL